MLRLQVGTRQGYQDGWGETTRMGQDKTIGQDGMRLLGLDKTRFWDETRRDYWDGT